MARSPRNRSPRRPAPASRPFIAGGRARPRSSSTPSPRKDARIDRPQEAAIRSGDLLGLLRAVIPAIAAAGPALRHLMAEAQSDPKLRVVFRERLIEPRREPLRQVLSVRILDAHKREALVAAIFG